MIDIDFIKESKELSSKLTVIRETLHRNPELGNCEYQTTAYIKNILKDIGVEIVEFGTTGLIGVLKGAHHGKTAAFRSDIDALPVTEETGCTFTSENAGVMHACGHDVHMTSLLGAAMILSKHRNDLHGSVMFVFEPDEEGNGKAREILELGLLKGVDACFGAHVDPNIPEGSIGIRYGKFYAASDIFKIKLEGKSAHAATPEKGIDATYGAAMLACKLKQLPKLLEPERAVITVGTLKSGTAVNILSGEAELTGIIRTLGNDSRSFLKEELRKTCSEVESETGCTITIQLRESYPGVVNHDNETAFVEKTCRVLLSPSHVRLISEATMTTEDFGYYLDKLPGCFYHLGAGCEYPLHSSKFLPSQQSYLLGAAVHAAIAYSFLNS